MSQYTPQPKKDPIKKSVQPRPRSIARDPAKSNQTIRAKNAVGQINASGRAKVELNQNVYEYTPLSEDEEKRLKQNSELQGLEHAIQRKFKDWKRLISALLPTSGNPYFFMQPFGFGDGSRFFGRHETINELLGQVKKKWDHLPGWHWKNEYPAGKADSRSRTGRTFAAFHICLE